MRRLDRDLLNHTTPKAAARATMAALNALQDYTPHEQVIATAVLFRELADLYGIPAQDAFTVAGNVLVSPEGNRRPEFRAVQAYLKGQVVPG